MKPKAPQLLPGGAQLSFSTVNNDEVGKGNWRPALVREAAHGIYHAFLTIHHLGVCSRPLLKNSSISSPDNLCHAREIILTFNCSDPVTPIASIIRNPINKPDHGPDNVVTADV